MGAPMYSMDDVRMQLNSTVCMYKGNPVFVTVDRDIDGRMVSITPLCYTGKRLSELVDYTSDHFDYRSPPLGYMFFLGCAYYVQRLPERRNKQGLYPDHMQIMDAVGNHISPAEVYTLKEMGDCIKGAHMPEDEALKLLALQKATSVPISRHVAIGRIDFRRTALFYRNRMVGTKENTQVGYTLAPGEDASFMHRILEKQVVII